MSVPLLYGMCATGTTSLPTPSASGAAAGAAVAGTLSMGSASRVAASRRRMVGTPYRDRADPVTGHPSASANRLLPRLGDDRQDLAGDGDGVRRGVRDRRTGHSDGETRADPLRDG